MAQWNVGIITYYFGKNYGSVLQAYALQEMVKRQGYNTFIIDYHNMSYVVSKKWRKSYYLNVISTVMRYPSRLIPFLASKKKSASGTGVQTNDVFHEFVMNNLELYQFDSSNQIDDIDSFICGSDQIWGLSLPGLNYATFLRFCDKSKRVAYAPSFGLNAVPYYNKKQLAKYLNGFSYLSVREMSAKKMIWELTHQDATLVLDPVLLAGYDFWNNHIGTSPYDNYIVCYFLDSSDEAKTYFMQNLSSEKRHIVWIDTGAEVFDSSYTIVKPTPLEFVSIISAASQVCTDSFHGTAFSIMMHTPFTVFKRNYRENPGQQTRIDSLLEITHLESRLYDENHLQHGHLHEIEFEFADRELDRLRFVSLKYLCDALERKT